MAYGKKGLVRGQNKDDQGEYSTAVQARQLNSEHRPSDSKLPKTSSKGRREVKRARKHLGM